jgi:hypothetical protein
MLLLLFRNAHTVPFSAAFVPDVEDLQANRSLPARSVAEKASQGEAVHSTVLRRNLKIAA